MSFRASAPLLIAAALLLAGCDRSSSPGFPNQTVTVGQGTSAPLTANFTGSWQITNVPAWITVTPLSGQGPMSVTVSVDRRAGTPLTADQPELSGSFEVTWQDVLRRSGTSTVQVRAAQFELTGRITDGQTASVQGADVAVQALRAQEPAETRGVIVKYRAGGAVTAQSARPEAQAAATLRAQGVNVGSVRALDARTSVLRVGDVRAALAALKADPAVEYAVPNAVLHPQQTGPLVFPVSPTDQYAPLQWPFRVTGYQAVWKDMQAGAYTRPVTVAVLDSGVRFDHPDLAGGLWGPGEGALDVLAGNNGDGDGPDTDPTDPLVPGRVGGSHGTHVTGLIVARWGENQGSCEGCSTTGVVGASAGAPVKVLPVRVIDAYGDAEVADVVTGVRYAAGLPVTLDGVTYTNPHPAQVMNLSLGGGISAQDARPMCDAIAEARAAGTLVVVAGGNGYSTVPYYPAACTDAVAVGSVTLSGPGTLTHAKYSNRYAQIVLSAPGGSDSVTDAFNGALLNGARFPDSVFSTSWNYTKDQPSYEGMSGTSQASPQVAALAALLLSKGVTTNATDTLERLIATSRDLGPAGRDESYGFGVINAAAALNAPAVTGLRVVDDAARNLLPRVQGTGEFRAWLGDGTYRVIAGTDVDANGVFGEVGEPRAETAVTLGASQPSVRLPDLVVR